jgi:hypothetical protein
MDDNLIDEFPQEEIQKIIQHAKNESIGKIVETAIDKYKKLDEKLGTNFSKEVLETLLWIAETKQSADAVENASKCFMLDEVDGLLFKYQSDMINLTQIFNNLTWAITDEPDVNLAKKYIEWVGNGRVSKLLNFVSEFSGNGNTKVQQDVFMMLEVRPSKIDAFENYASKITRKKIPLEKKVELLSFLRDIIKVNKDNYADILIRNGLEDLRREVEKDLRNLKFQDSYSLRCGIKFSENFKNDPNIFFLYNKVLEHGSFKKWFESDDVVQKVMEKMENQGIDPKIFVNSGKVIAQKRPNGIFSENWVDVFKRISIKVLGSKKNELLPKILIPNQSPGSMFKKIKQDYFLALNQDKEAAGSVLNLFKQRITDSYQNKKMPKSTSEVLNSIEGLIKMIDDGTIFTFRGARVTARVWKRTIPQDFYDSELLWCCWFLPQGEQQEIPLFLMDPQTTALQFYVQGIINPISVAFFYAGKVDGEPTLLVDTWEGGSFAYISLGQEKMKEFVLDAMLKFSKKCGAKKLLIHAGANYSRAKEFRNFLRDKGMVPQEVCFESVDSDDVILQKYSLNKKHHTTDSFGVNPLKGTIEAFVLSC